MKAAVERLLINLADLLKVKSIITFVIIFTISFLVIKNIAIPPEYAAFAGSIITYFFTKANTETK